MFSFCLSVCLLSRNFILVHWYILIISRSLWSVNTLPHLIIWKKWNLIWIWAVIMLKHCNFSILLYLWLLKLKAVLVTQCMFNFQKSVQKRGRLGNLIAQSICCKGRVCLRQFTFMSLFSRYHTTQERKLSCVLVFISRDTWGGWE